MSTDDIEWNRGVDLDLHAEDREVKVALQENTLGAAIRCALLFDPKVTDIAWSALDGTRMYAFMNSSRGWGLLKQERIEYMVRKGRAQYLEENPEMAWLCNTLVSDGAFVAFYLKNIIEELDREIDMSSF